VIAANLLFKMPLVGTPSASDAAREVSPYKGGLGGFISDFGGRWWFSSHDSSNNLQQ
jgi:hypothetical protein